MEKVLIAIQARSTSQRFPNKIMADIGGKPLLQHVIDSCEKAAQNISAHTRKKKISVDVCLVIPDDDPIKNHFRIKCYEGSELDVLGRYYKAARQAKPDYIVRVTGDCPLIPSPVIAKTINTIVMNGYDYVSNVYESVRGYQDGSDCEAFTFDLLLDAQCYATEKEDREHVTTWMRRNTKNIGHIVPFIHNLNGPKLSVDTEEDLKRVIETYELGQKAERKAEDLHGKKSLHRF